MESDAFECDADGCAARAKWLVWIRNYDKFKFFACAHDADAMLKAVSLMNTKIKGGKVVIKRIDDVLITDPRLLKKPTT